MASNYFKHVYIYILNFQGMKDACPVRKATILLLAEMVLHRAIWLDKRLGSLGGAFCKN